MKKEMNTIPLTTTRQLTDVKYFCKKCQINHRFTSKVGKKHFFQLEYGTEIFISGKVNNYTKG